MRLKFVAYNLNYAEIEFNIKLVVNLKRDTRKMVVWQVGILEWVNCNHA